VRRVAPARGRVNASNGSAAVAASQASDHLARAQSGMPCGNSGRAPADALGVKQELEKALALNGKPTK
jgi:hypothetical protein